MKRKKISLFDAVNILFMLLVVFLCVYPMYITIICSISDSGAVANGEVIWKPVGLTFSAYQEVFKTKTIWRGYANSIYYTAFGTVFSLCVLIPASYVMSKVYLPHRKVLMTFFLITMYFGGGLIPTYLLIKNLGLIDTRAVLIIGGISVYNLIVTKTFFMTSISNTLYEAAEVDGASELKRFVSIALPLSKPIIAVMALYNMVGRWNGYFSAMIYINDRKLDPLQTVLRRILISGEMILDQVLTNQKNGGKVDAHLIMDAVEQMELAYTMKYAVVFIASLPLLIAYPFVQKHFVKGVMVGSLKE